MPAQDRPQRPTRNSGQPLDTAEPQPALWTMDAAAASTATLLILAATRRQRRFEIVCAVSVLVPERAHRGWLQMTVQANGTQRWQRPETAHTLGYWDGQGYRFSREVPVGQDALYSRKESISSMTKPGSSLPVLASMWAMKPLQPDVQRSLLGAVVLEVERGAIRRRLGLSADGRPTW